MTFKKHQHNSAEGFKKIFLSLMVMTLPSVESVFLRTIAFLQQIFSCFNVLHMEWYYSVKNSAVIFLWMDTFIGLSPESLRY